MQRKNSEVRVDSVRADWKKSTLALFVAAVSIEEQEICINAMRDEKFATIYTSDSTYITKLDKRLLMILMPIQINTQIKSKRH